MTQIPTIDGKVSYREKVDIPRIQDRALQVLAEMILSASEDDVSSIAHKIHSCDNLESEAQRIVNPDADRRAATPEERTMTLATL